MAIAGLLGLALPLVSGIAGLFGNKSSAKQTDNSSGEFEKGTVGSQLDLPPELLQQLGGLFGGLVGTGAGEAAQDATRSRLLKLQSFDPAAFADAVTKQAASSVGIEVGRATNNAAMDAGGAGNTMTKLLESKIRNEAAANLGGIAASARATGEDIANRGVAGLSESLMKGITDIIAVTRGAAATGTMGEKGAQKGTVTSNSSGSSGGGLGGFFSGLASGLDTYWNSARQ